MEYVFEGAKVYTLDKNDQIAQAMVVENGRIKRTGSREELKRDHPKAKVISLNGESIIPGFNDCHSHIVHAGFDLARPSLRHCASVAEIQQTLRSWADEHPNAPWIVGRSYDQNTLAEGRHITRRELDEVGSGKPVYIFHLSGHAGVASTLALEAAGITNDTKDPSDGVIVRDESGIATGLLLEVAVLLVASAMPEASMEEMAQAIYQAGVFYAQRGILAASDAYTGKNYGMEKEWQAYARALELGSLVRTTLMPHVDTAFEVGWQERANVVLPARHSELRLGAIKILADGALSSRTAALHDPFEDEDTTGILIYPEEELVDLIVKSHLGGWQIAVHGIGDRAIDLCLDGIGKGQSLVPRQDARHRIEHCMMMTDSILDRLVDLNVYACAQPEFIYWLAHAYKKGLGSRADRLQPYRTWIDRGIPQCYGSDQPVTPGDPIIGWRAAVDRKGQDGTVLGPEETLDPITALKGFTLGSAEATFDDEIGSLEPGKQARFVVLNLPPEKILNESMKVVTNGYELMSD